MICEWGKCEDGSTLAHVIEEVVEHVGGLQHEVVAQAQRPKSIGSTEAANVRRSEAREERTKRKRSAGGDARGGISGEHAGAPDGGKKA